MQDLIAWAEKLESPNRAVDKAIAEAVGWRRDQQDVQGRWLYTRPDSHGTHYLPEFTSSIDAALPGEDIVYMRKVTDAEGRQWYEVQQSGSYSHTGKHALEAIARRIAALRAREIPSRQRHDGTNGES